VITRSFNRAPCYGRSTEAMRRRRAAATPGHHVVEDEAQEVT
jgi:hypothetical protein